MNFEEYLSSKKIDSKAFESAEKRLFDSMKAEFEQMHPNSFTMQKLNLINPVRRKYPLAPPAGQSAQNPPPESSQPKAARPVMKPKPKIN